MRHIYKKISLEPLKSRVPSLVAAYDTQNGERIPFHFSGLTIDSESFRGNYGMIPENVIVMVGEKSENWSWNTVAQRHKFFMDYYALLKPDDSSLIKPYTSAMNFYEVNFPNGNQEEYEKYQTLDTLYKEYGGDVTAKYICENCYNEIIIPWGEKFKTKDSKELTLPYDLYFEWHCLKLQYTVIIQKLAQFKAWYEKYNLDENKKELDEVNCLETEDCCDCSEYLRLGGKVMYRWLEQCKLPESEVKTDSASTYITIPIYIGNTIDDMGEMSNMAEEWQMGEKYTKDSVVSYLNNDWILKDAEKYGTAYNDAFKEMYFGNLAWDNENGLYKLGKTNENDSHWDRSIYRYFTLLDGEKNKKENEEKIQSYCVNGSGYTYKNNVYISNPNETNMIETYPITINKSNIYVINGNICEAQELLYVIYQSTNRVNTKYNGKNFIVEVKGGKAYTTINNKRYEGISQGSGKFAFIFDKKGCSYQGTICQVMKGSFIKYNGTLYEVTKDSNNKDCICIPQNFVYYDPTLQAKTIAKNYYYPIDAYFTIGVANFYIKIEVDSKGAEVGKLYDYKIEPKGFNRYYEWEKVNEETLDFVLKSIDVDKKKEVEILYPYEIYSKCYISGETESKLSSFVNTIAKDDFGNQLPGMYTMKVLDTSISNNTNNPSISRYAYEKPEEDGYILDLYYQVGTVRDLEKINETYYWGNLLRSIEYYYLDNEGNKVNETSVLITVDADIDNGILSINDGTLSNSGYSFNYQYVNQIEYDFTNISYMVDLKYAYEISLNDIKDMTLEQATYLLPYVDKSTIEVSSSGQTSFKIIGLGNVSGITTQVEFLNDNKESVEKESVEEESVTFLKITINLKGYIKDKKTPISNIDAINLCKALHDIKNIGVYTDSSDIIVSDSLRCEIKYNIGAILKRNKLSNVDTYTLTNDTSGFDGTTYHKGVEYTEEWGLTLREYPYQITELSTIMLYYYDIGYNERNIVLSDYDGYKYKEVMAKFKVEINAWNVVGDTVSPLSSHFKMYETCNTETDASCSFDPSNDMTNFPLMRLESCLGFSTIENIQGDIYIDRGVAQAFSPHLKLSEIKSFEALENYGNGSFRIEYS